MSGVPGAQRKSRRSTRGTKLRNFSKFFDRRRGPVPEPPGAEGVPRRAGSTRGLKLGFLSKCFDRRRGPVPEPPGAEGVPRRAGSTRGLKLGFLSKCFDRRRGTRPRTSGRRPPTVAETKTDISKLPSSRFQKPSFRKHRPPGGGPERPQDLRPTLGGCRPGRLCRNSPLRTAVLCHALLRQGTPTDWQT